MGQRQAKPSAAPPFKTWDDFIQCEVDGAHLVRPPSWPPPTKGLDPGSFSLRCERCGTNCIVEERHAEPNPWFEVIMPKVKQPA